MGAERAVVVFRSFARCQNRPSQAQVRATTQRRGRRNTALGGLVAAHECKRPSPRPAERADARVFRMAYLGKQVVQPNKSGSKSPR
jgi:hypothetical protein